MNLAAAIKFLRDHPNLLRLLEGLPRFRRPTIDALVDFVDDALASGDPDSYVSGFLSEIRNRRQTKPVKVTVIESKERR